MDPATPAKGASSLATAAGESALRRLRAWVVAAPGYPPDAGDLRALDVLGLRLPVRATIALVLVSLITMLDHGGGLFTLFWDGSGTTPELLRARALSRLVFLGGGALVVLLLLRDSPRRYGVRLGDVRAGSCSGPPAAC